MAAGLGSASEPWGSSGVCGLPGAAPSAERAVCPSGEQQSGGGLCLFLFYAEFKAQPSPQLLSSPVYLLSIRLGAPRALGDRSVPCSSSCALQVQDSTNRGTISSRSRYHSSHHCKSYFTYFVVICRQCRLAQALCVSLSDPCLPQELPPRARGFWGSR